MKKIKIEAIRQWFLKHNLKIVKRWAIQHKFLSCVLIIGIASLGYGGFRYIQNKTVKNTYVLNSVEKGAFISTITGSGQISASDQLSLTAKVSGTLTSIKVVEGQKVKKGTLIAQIDCPQVYASLENARISLARLEQSDPLSTLQLQNALTSAQESVIKAQNDSDQAYGDGYDVISNASLNIPAIITNLKDVFYSSSGYLSTDVYNYLADHMLSNQRDTAKSYIQIAALDYDAAKIQYDLNFKQYKSLNRDSSQNDIENLINNTYKTLLLLSQSIKEAKNATDYLAYNQLITNIAISASSTQANLTTWLAQVEAHVQALETIKNTLKTTQNSLNSANRTIEEKTQSLKNGTSSLDMQSQQLSLEQAQRNYNDCFVTAPFDGLVVDISAKTSRSINSGETVATLITENKIATISLNEIDATKIAVGQVADLTFDAIDGLTLKGTVSKVDSLGTVDQGVVSYAVIITLDTSDEKVKSGMSVNTAITTENRPNVILVPNAAVKSGLGGRHYVEISDDQSVKNSKAKLITTIITPKRQTVEIGSSNDTVTEISSGLNVGDFVVIKTTATKASTTNSQSATPTISTRNFTGAGGGMMIPR
ncbi:MAG: HlyD family efflux transporter periplasmic adaptor subunit [Candidatus Parcubacteria bacterium]|nr:HlyD family efflux transporter periplasmic adaptor subunit [Candidatus Parcubacteria bacterium]